MFLDDGSDQRLMSKILDFHKSIVNHYRETEKLCRDLAEQRLTIEIARRAINRAIHSMHELRGNCEMHYWLARAYAKRYPGKSSNRFFVSCHVDLLDRTLFFLDHFLDYPRTDSASVEEDTVPEDSCQMPLMCFSIGLERLASIAEYYQRALPELNDKLSSALRSEAKLAYKLLTEPDHAEATKEPPPGRSTAAEALLDEIGLEIFGIADSAISVDDKMRAICRTDQRCLAWKSPQWAELLNVTAAAIRQTSFWKYDRLKAIEAGRVLSEDNSVTRR